MLEGWNEPGQRISSAELERMMKVWKVIANAGSLRWWEVPEILGVRGGTIRRWQERHQLGRLDGLYDRRKWRPSPKRMPAETIEKVPQLCRESYLMSGSFTKTRGRASGSATRG